MLFSSGAMLDLLICSMLIKGSWALQVVEILVQGSEVTVQDVLRHQVTRCSSSMSIRITVSHMQPGCAVSKKLAQRLGALPSCTRLFCNAMSMSRHG